MAPFSFTPKLMLLALCFSLGCHSQQPLRPPETFDDIYEQRESLRDSVITLAGQFIGWGGAGCEFPPYAARQATRSDWIFRMGGQCLYVTGGSPPGMLAMEATPAGEPIALEARVRVTHDDRLLLEYVRSTPTSQ